ncbi:MAG: YggS family pyridoxal phosphate-dependent enzyme [Candidatus Omnitrophica bacterium]|nr:YggS family pyridoxal phosphate-dependent enzyme [Candidatus Omnitrophota bacterium]
MLKDNIIKVKERIAQVCLRVGRKPEEITILAVTKGRNAEEIKEVISCGIEEIGENRVQEALLKFDDKRHAISDKPKLHMVGHLQTNKVKEAVKIFDLIQSVDSLHLAQEIDKQAAKIKKVQDCLIEVKTSPEATKFGIEPDTVIDLIKEIQALKNIRIQGLMTIAPVVDNSEQARPYFRRLREILHAVNDKRCAISHMHILSMGMSADFEVAIEEGSTMIRIGRAIFEG